MDNESTGKKHQSGRVNGYLTAILLVALIYMATVQVKAWWSGQSAPKITPRAVTPRADLGEDEKATINLFEETSPSVVFITTINLRRDFFSTNIYKIPAGTGSTKIKWQETADSRDLALSKETQSETEEKQLPTT